MSVTNVEDVEERCVVDFSPKDHVIVEVSTDDLKQLDKNDENSIPSPQEEEEMIKKKYGGILPKKPPLISKDHERAFFDSADWALGKGSQKPKGPLETLRPKLEPTPHQQVRSRRSAYAISDDSEDDVDNSSNANPEPKDQSMLDGGDTNNASIESKSCREHLNL